MKPQIRILVIFMTLFALPIYWSADKTLQLYATSIAKDRVLARVEDESYLSALFGIPLPFKHADYMLFRGKSLTDNILAEYLNSNPEVPSKKFRIYFEFTDGVGKKHWFEYSADTCGVRYCPFEIKKFSEIPVSSLNWSEGVVREKVVSEWILGYEIHERFMISIYADETITNLYVDVRNKGRNPIDRTLRQLMASQGPDYWHGHWRFSRNYTTGRTEIGEW